MSVFFVCLLRVGSPINTQGTYLTAALKREEKTDLEKLNRRNKMDITLTFFSRCHILIYNGSLLIIFKTRTTRYDTELSNGEQAIIYVDSSLVNLMII